jgi:hypothetical protein
MCRLLDAHFLGVTRDLFEADLAEKDHALLIEDGGGRLRGFTTFARVPMEVEGERLHVLYSGDTIVESSARGSFALAQGWIGAVRRLRRALPPGERLVWLLICSGPRTYRFLPVFFRRFYPHREHPTPGPEQNLMETLAAARYGAGYDPAAGVVRLAHPQPLRPEFREISKGEDPHVAFFLDRNPGHEQGDELVCLTELDDGNLTPAGRRMVEGADRKRGERRGGGEAP